MAIQAAPPLNDRSAPEPKKQRAPLTFRAMVISPDSVSSLWRKFFHHADRMVGFDRSNVAGWVAVMTAPDTIIYEMIDPARTDDQCLGVLYFTGIDRGRSITPDRSEAIACAHMMCWSSRALRDVELHRQILRHFIGTYGIHRVIAEFAVEQKQTVSAASKVGFRRVGRLRERIAVGRSGWSDAWLMELMASDILPTKEIT